MLVCSATSSCYFISHPANHSISFTWVLPQNSQLSDTEGFDGSVCSFYHHVAMSLSGFFLQMLCKNEGFTDFVFSFLHSCLHMCSSRSPELWTFLLGLVISYWLQIPEHDGFTWIMRMSRRDDRMPKHTQQDRNKLLRQFTTERKNKDTSSLQSSGVGRWGGGVTLNQRVVHSPCGN